MRISVTLERKINWKDKQRKFTGYSPDELFNLIKEIIIVNGLKMNRVDREARILDTRIINRSKVNIKVEDQKIDNSGERYCVVKCNILNAYSPSPYENFWRIVEKYLGG